MHVKLPTLNMHVNFYSRVKIRNMHLDKLCNSPKSNHDLIKRINETYRKKSLEAYIVIVNDIGVEAKQLFGNVNIIPSRFAARHDVYIR